MTTYTIYSILLGLQKCHYYLSFFFISVYTTYVEIFENEDCELHVSNIRLGCYTVSQKKPPQSKYVMLHSTSCWMNTSLGPKSCPDLPFPHDPDVLLEQDVIDGFLHYPIWMDTLVFAKVMDWTGLEKIKLDKTIL